MTNKDYIRWLKLLDDELTFDALVDGKDEMDMHEMIFELCEKLVQEPKIDRLYSWLNDMRFGIAPDETTPQDERADRLAQVDIIDEIMEWLEKNEQDK